MAGILAVLCLAPRLVRCVAGPVAVVVSLTGLSETVAASDTAPLSRAAVDVADMDITELARVVTGSAVPTTPDAVAVQVIALDEAKMAQLGLSDNALEVLRKAIPAFAGRSNTGTANANNNIQKTAGGSSVQLRNLPTLVLVNGRRMASSAVGGLNGKGFVDVSQIPAAAIDHIEVLTDGASSLYGSDAIGGVVNFILKSNYEGITAGIRYGSADDYHERSVYVTAGTKLSNVSITATGSFSLTDLLYQNERSFTSPLVGKTSSIPGVVAGGNAVLAPGLSSPSQTNPTGTAATAPSLSQLIANGTYNPTTPAGISAGFDVSPYQTLLLKQQHDSLVLGLSAPLMDDRLEAFGDALVSRGKSETRWLPVPFTGISVPQNSPYNPLTTAFTGVVFEDLSKPQKISNTTWGVRIIAGLRGNLSGDWNWETGLTYSESTLEQKVANLIYKPNMALAIAGGFDANGNTVTGGAYSKVHSGYSATGPLVLQPALDPFARAEGINSAAIANLYGTEVLNADSKLTAIDAKVVGSLFTLPAGKVGAAVGLSARREALSGHADANGRVTDPITGSTTGNDQQWVSAAGSFGSAASFVDPFDAHRDIEAVFLEVRVPITSQIWSIPGFHAFDLTGAGRAEKYSDVGSSTVPKVGFRWQPFDQQLTIRGNYSKSFSAPGLYAEYGPTDTRQVGSAVLAGLFGNSYALQFNGEDGNNPKLKSVTSISRSIGFVMKPDILRGLNITVDYSSIILQGYAGGIGFNNIISSVNTLGSASPYFSNLAIDGFAGSPGATQPFTTPGALKTFLTNATTQQGDPAQANRLYVIDQFRNLGTLIEHSYSLSADYAIPTDRFGTFDIRTTGAIFSTVKFQSLPSQPFIEFAGHSDASGIFGGTLPKYRFYTNLDWSIHRWDLSIGNTYAASTTDTGVNGTSTPEIKVDRYLAWDMRVGYDWRPASRSGMELKFALGVNNLTNQMPPLAPRAFADNNADVSAFSPIGRLVYGTVMVKF